MIAGRFVTVDRIFRELVAKAATGPVLEIGCGDGRMLELLRAEGRDVVGVDIELRPLRRASTRGLSKRVCGDGERLPFADGSFGAAISGFFSANLMNRERMVAEAARVLRPGGVLAYSLLNPWTRLPDVLQYRLLRGEWVDPAWVIRYAQRLGNPRAEPSRLRRNGLVPDALRGAAWLPLLRRIEWIQARTPVVHGCLWPLSWDVVISGRKELG